MKYRPEIDGLRAIAVLPVIFFHAGFETFSGGFVGVDVFFVISGYLIATIIVDELDTGSFRLSNFYERRARRILPALFVVILICLPLAFVWLLPRDMKDFMQSIVAVTTFSSNIFFWLKSGYFDTAAELKPLLHTWSLAVEEQFYIIFPLFLMLTWRLGIRWVLAGLFILFSASLIAAEWASYNQPRAAFFLLPTRAWELLIGAFTALYLRRSKPELPPIASEIASFLGTALILWAVLSYHRTTPFPGLYALAPTIGTALLILFARDGVLVHRLLKVKPLVTIGLISYSAYLIHQPLLAFAKYRSPTEPSNELMFALCAVTFPLAYANWWYVERPFRVKGKISTRALVGGFSTAAIALTAVGLVGHLSGGYAALLAKRYDASVAAVANQFSTAYLYVSKRWREELVLRDFDADAETANVLLIGDSYAQDLANAIYESDLADRYYLSAYHISRRCGNVWTDKDLTDHIEATHQATCNEHERFTNQRVLRLMAQADEVWLTASWREWQLPYLAETIERISASSSARIRLFGRKNLGQDVSFYNFLDKTQGGELPFILEVSEQHRETNEIMRKTIPEDIFVDISALLCGSTSHCRNSTDEGLIISFDGGHLTKEGAAYLGEKLKIVL